MTDSEDISAEQCRAARALLDWSQITLAERAGVGVSTVRDYEAGRRVPRMSSMTAIRSALEKAGVEFLAEGDSSTGGGPGVRLRPARKSKPRR